MVAIEANAFIGLGSNLGDARTHVEQGLTALGDINGTQLQRRSRLYRTPPWGLLEQPAFVNAVAEIRTTLAPRRLLEALLGIERDHGRKRERDEVRWGPRTLDLDLLVYGDVKSAETGLVLPHPRIAQRAFVLLPLADLDRGLDIPGAGVVGDLLAQLDTRDCVLLD